VIFTANSGHKRGHLGLDDFMAHRPLEAPDGAQVEIIEKM
jgi:hypothetical protein